MFKKSLLSFAVMGLCGVSTIADAKDLVIRNFTAQDSTSFINGNCTNQFQGGVTHAGSPTNPTKNTIPDSLIKIICAKTPDHCEAHVFMTNDCSGSEISTIIYVVGNGVQLPVTTNPPYNIVVRTPDYIELHRK